MTNFEQLMPLLCFTYFIFEVPEIPKFSQIFKKSTRETRPIEKYATYEAKNFRKVVSKQKTNLQKSFVGIRKACKNLRGKNCEGVKNYPPPFD